MQLEILTDNDKAAKMFSWEKYLHTEKFENFINFDKNQSYLPKASTFTQEISKLALAYRDIRKTKSRCFPKALYALAFHQYLWYSFFL